MFKELRHGMLKAQFTMRTLLEIGLMLIVYAQIYPFLIEEPLADIISTSDPVTAALLSLLPFLIAAIIIIGVISYNSLRNR